MRVRSRHHYALALLLFASAEVASAQFVSIAGEYGTAESFRRHHPLNPPSELSCPASEARCFRRAVGIFGVPAGTRATRAQTGVRALPRVAPPQPGPAEPLAVGDPILVPPMLFEQTSPPRQRALVGGALTGFENHWTDLDYALPAAGRANGAPSETRRFARRTFSTSDVIAHGQNNGLSTAHPSYSYRRSTNTTFTTTTVLSDAVVRYRGGLGFSGTMAALMRGLERGHDVHPMLQTPTSLVPIVLRTTRFDESTWVTRHGAGWNYVVSITHPSPPIRKGFPSAPSVIGPTCASTPPPSPVGCQLVSGFDSAGTTLPPLYTAPPANSRRRLFPWTTGTVSIDHRRIISGQGTSTITLTAMGYDRTTISSMGAEVRQIGLVAGSVVQRQTRFVAYGAPAIIGVDLEIVPEPRVRAALFASLAWFAAIGRRRPTRSGGSRYEHRRSGKVRVGGRSR